MFIPPEVLASVVETAVPLVNDCHDKTSYPDFDPACVLGLVRDIRFDDGPLPAEAVIWCPETIAAIKAGAGPRQLSIASTPNTGWRKSPPPMIS